MFDRNRYFIDNTDMLVNVYYGTSGGTQQACDYARNFRMAVYRI